MTDARQPDAVEIFDTTLRDGAQLEGISLTVDDKLRIAEQLDHLGVHWIEGGWPGANPKDEEFFRARRDRAEPHDVDAGGLRLDPAGQGQGRRRPDPRATSSRPARRRCASSASGGTSTSPRRCGTTLDEGVAMVADSVEFLRGHGLGVFFDAEHFFDGYKRNPEFALRVLEAAAVERCRRRSCCATPTAARCRSRSSRSSARSSGYFGDDVTIGDPHPQRHRLRASRTRSPACAAGADAGAGHDQRLRRAHRQLQPHDDHPEPHAEDGHRDAARRTGWSG